VSLVDLSRLDKALASHSALQISGRVRRVSGLLVEASLPGVAVGTSCSIHRPHEEDLAAEVVGFADGRALLLTLGSTRGIAEGAEVRPASELTSIPVGEGLLGRVVGPQIEALDIATRGPLPKLSQRASIEAAPPPAMTRRRIQHPLDLGVRSLDTFLTLGEGQRVGIFAPPGVGKSSLLGMLARSADADVIVVGLIGERGREVREFIERDLGEKGLARSVVVVATGDASPLLRMRAAKSATAIAEYFRAEGNRVLLLMDSLSRVAMAGREVGLAAGEPPTARGYPPSVFAMLPSLLERAGTHEGEGSITALYTVLIENEGLGDPVAEAARAALDGHITLSPKLASRGHYPAIDLSQSVSRVMSDIVQPEAIELSRAARELLAVYDESADLIEIGAYQRGTNPRVDLAITLREPLMAFLAQPIDERTPRNEALMALAKLLSSAARRGA